MATDFRSDSPVEAKHHAQPSDNLQDARLPKPVELAANTAGQKQGANTDNAKLEDSKVIPKLELTDNSPKRKDWTVAIELGSNLPGNTDKPLGWGADQKLKQLKDLAKETEGKSVNFVVHAERPTDKHGKPCIPDDASSVTDKKAIDKVAACVTSAEEDGRATTERYFIHDGKIDRMPDKKYKDAGQDIKALLKEANEISPSDKIGLLIQSHGTGKDGIKTGLGELPLDKTMTAIKDGLKGSQHEKLDMLNFDACNMGNAEVLDKSSKVAKSLVASSGVEGATKSGDGQNIVESMRALLHNPKMTGKELGEAIVNLAKNGVNGRGEENSTQTLASFDLSQHGQFVSSMDRLGKALTAATKDPANMKVVQSMIENTAMPNAGGEEFEAHNRDLKDFSNNIVNDIRSGKYKGDTTELRAAAEAMTTSIDKMTTAQAMDPETSSGTMAGLTTSIPGKAILDRKELAKGLSPLHQLNVLFNPPAEDKEAAPPKGSKVKPGQKPEPDLTMDMKPDIVKSLDEKLNELKDGMGPEFRREMRQLTEARDNVDKSKSVKQLEENITEMGRVAKFVDEGRMGREIMRTLAGQTYSIQSDLLQKMQEKSTPNWDKFIKRVKRQAQ